MVCVKAILDFQGMNKRYVFQGVHMLMDGAPRVIGQGGPQNFQDVSLAGI